MTEGLLYFISISVFVNYIIMKEVLKENILGASSIFLFGSGAKNNNDRGITKKEVLW